MIIQPILYSIMAIFNVTGRCSVYMEVSTFYTMVLFKLTYECSFCILDTYLHSTMVLFKSVAIATQ